MNINNHNKYSYDTNYDTDDDDDFEILFISSSDDTNRDDYNLKMKKKVTFNLKPIIYKIIAWDFAYRASRKSNWEVLARDRIRFRNKINTLELILTPILKVEHRLKVWLRIYAKKNN
ncbi:MAG: protein phosphatase 1 regulatory subunit 15b like [Cotesia congregata filamentous virus 2]